MLLHTVGAIKTFHTSLVQTLLYVWDGLLSISHSQVRIFTFLGLLTSYFPSLLLDPNLGQCGGKTWNCEGKKYVVPFYISQLMWGDQNAYSAFRQKKSSGMDNKLNVVWNTVFQQGQNWGDSVFFGKVIHFLVEFSFFFCALLYVRYCEYSGVHWADSREEAPSHAACSAVGTLCQPHCCLHTGRERSCHQVGAHRIMINAANSHFTAFIFA